jgi:3-oxoacyl-[acyl-carrier protein] reductase
MKLLENKVSIITGATRGIGRGIALKFAEQGSDIVFTFRSSVNQADELAKEIETFGVKALYFQSDAADSLQADAIVNQTLETFGRVDILVNNAGITQDNLLMRMSEEQWDNVINTNLKSVFNFTKSITKPMLKQRKGSVINISSIVGNGGNAGQANYSASKAGINGFTKSVAIELGSRNIRVNAIAPGFIETEMTGQLDTTVVENWVKNIPLKRGGTPEDVANLALFLASDLSTYITGQVINVCGGLQTA